MDSRKWLSAAVLALAAAAVYAYDAEFVSPTGYFVSGWQLGRWKDRATGAIPSALPTSRVDNVHFGEPSNSAWQPSVYTGTGNDFGSFLPVELNALHGSEAWTLVNSPEQTSVTAQGSDKRVTIADPTGFDGYFFNGYARVGWSFPGNAGTTQRVSSVSLRCRPIVETPSQGTSVAVDDFYSAGALEKWGAGELVVNGTSGAHTRLYVKDGDVSFGDGIADDLDEILDAAFLHLDATAAATLKTASNGDGRTYVTNWCDVRGNGQGAHVPLPSEMVSGYEKIQSANSPFLAVGAGRKGQNMINFGTAWTPDSGTRFGPTNCTMRFERREDVRDVFYVARYHDRPQFNPVLGDWVSAPTLQPCAGLLGGSANWGARTGAIFADGVKILPNHYPDNGYGFTNQTVYSFSSKSNLVLSAIASDQDRPFAGTLPDAAQARIGGMLVGEILLFTNELTRAQRNRVNAYLVDKWQGPSGEVWADVGLLDIQKDGASVNVAPGTTATVLDLKSGGVVTKTGGGTLAVDAVYPQDTTFDVKGGSVRIGGLVSSVDDQAPASGPAVWLDASCSESLEKETIDGSPYVTRWNDRRRNGIYATASVEKGAPRIPTEVKDASPTGLDVLSLGGNSSTSSYFAFPWRSASNGTKKFYAGFAVLRRTAGSDTAFGIFGAADMTFMCEGSEGGTHHRFISEKYTCSATSAAIWTYNGVPRDPIVYHADMSDMSNFFVVAFAAEEKVLVDAIAWNRNSPNYCGGMEIGEFILYDRPVSDAERRSTEAYLMKKWNDASHPTSGTPKPNYAFAEDVDAIVDMADDCTLGTVSGGSGRFVKRGSGNVSLAAVPDGTESLSVEGGTLSLSLSSFIDDALYHFDMNAEDTLEYGESPDQGTVVTRWKDVRGNGVYAEAVKPGDVSDGRGLTKKYPTIAELSTDGVVGRYLDFGGVGSANSAAMWMNRNFLNVREVHVIHRDIGKNSLFASFSHFNTNAAHSTAWEDHQPWADYYRDVSGSFCGSAASGSVTNGTFWSNGQMVANPLTDMLPTSPSLVSIATTNNTHVNSIQEDRGVPGGAYVGEQIAFSRLLTDRERGYLMAHMMHKWFDAGVEPVWTNLTVTALHIASGASLDVSGSNVVVSAAELGGAGTLTGASVIGVSSMRFDVNDFGKSHLTVSGSVRFAGDVAVTLANAEADGMLVPGDYVLFEALGGIEPANAVNFAIEAPVLSGRRTYTFIRRGGTLTLRIAQRGLRITVR